MKPLTGEQASDLADNFETLSANMDAITTALRDFDDDDCKASTRTVCEAIIEDDLLGGDWTKAISKLRRLLGAYEAGDFDGIDGSTMGAAVAHEALWSVALDPSLVTSWTGNGTGIVDLGVVDFSEVDDVPDMGGTEAIFELDGRNISLTFEDDEWGECTATGVLDEDDERLAALVSVQVDNG